MSLLLAVISLILFTTESQDIIWNSMMDGNDLSGDGWTVMTDITQYESNANCPNGGGCWSLCSSNLKSAADNAFIFKTSSTVGYENIKLKFNVNPISMSFPEEYCNF
eukprot:381165_1